MSHDLPRQIPHDCVEKAIVVNCSCMSIVTHFLQEKEDMSQIG